jgi:hypothetical protein
VIECVSHVSGRCVLIHLGDREPRVEERSLDLAPQRAWTMFVEELPGPVPVLRSQSEADRDGGG